MCLFLQDIIINDRTREKCQADSGADRAGHALTQKDSAGTFHK